MNTNQTPNKLSLIKFYSFLIFITVIFNPFFYITQSFFGSRPLPKTCVGDVLFDITVPINHFLQTHPTLANACLIIESASYDIVVLFIIILTFVKRTLQPGLGLIILVVLRSIMQFLCPLPPPDTMIWHYPGFPALFSTYYSSNDFFFSGHTAVSVFVIFAAKELINKKWVTSFFVFLLFLIVFLLIILRLHYTLDIYAGLTTGLLVAAFIKHLSRPVDQALYKWSGLTPQEKVSQ